MSKPDEAPVEKGIPNLDDWEISHLWSIKHALNDLRRYCEYREMAHIARVAGRIEVAKSHEASMAYIYSGLPGWAKW